MTGPIIDYLPDFTADRSLCITSGVCNVVHVGPIAEWESVTYTSHHPLDNVTHNIDLNQTLSTFLRLFFRDKLQEEKGIKWIASVKCGPITFQKSFLIYVFLLRYFMFLCTFLILFRFLTILDKTDLTILVLVFLWTDFLFLMDQMIGVKLLNHSLYVCFTL